MRIRPIKTKQDHSAALKRIEKLMSAAQDSPEEDELDVLATLVDAYETEHFVMGAPDAVMAIQFQMEQQGLTTKAPKPMGGRR